MSKTHIRFNDDIDSYEPSDSEDDYTEKEKSILNKYRAPVADNADSEEEIYGLQASSSEDDNESEIEEDDIDGQEDDDLPDERAWGEGKRTFYSTDYVDQDYGGHQGKDAQGADFEEDTAVNIQEKLKDDLDNKDYYLDTIKKILVLNKSLGSDDKQLAEPELEDYMKKESPEFDIILDDLKVKIDELKTYIIPMLKYVKEGKFPADNYGISFIKKYYELCLGYALNIVMYSTAKTSPTYLITHPIIKRLYDYREQISRTEPLYKKIRPQLEILLHLAAKTKKPKKSKKSINGFEVTDNEVNVSRISTDSATKASKRRSRLNTEESILDNYFMNVDGRDSSDSDANDISELVTTKELNHKRGEIPIMTTNGMSGNMVTDSDDSTDSDNANGDLEVEDDTEPLQENVNETGPTKRAITYQIAKNKGLMPHRNKEVRNPRVKHRNKYRKAKICRKGAVREVRTEMARYGGEISGIKASVSKSIKIK